MMEVREQVLRGLTQIDRDLEQARRDLERAKKLDDMVAEMREQHKHRREASEQAMAVLGREEERALAGESGPLTALWAGMPADPVKREESRELMEAQARYEAALWDLSDLEDRLWTAKEERAGLEGVEERYQALLGEKERFLCCTGSTQVQRLVQIAKELGSVRSGLQDLKDAVQAGEAAQVQLRAMTGTLESAREWESWERGGLLSVVGRTAGLEEVQAQGGEIRQALSRLRTQLARVAQEKVPGADLEGFLAFADYFFEGVFSDLFSHAGLERAQGEVENILCEVDTLMESLREGLDALQAKEQDLRQERETLLAGEERSMSHGTDTAAGDPSDLD